MYCPACDFKSPGSTGLSAIFLNWGNGSNIYRMQVQRAEPCIYHFNNVTGFSLVLMKSV